MRRSVAVENAYFFDSAGKFLSCSFNEAFGILPPSILVMRRTLLPTLPHSYCGVRQFPLMFSNVTS
jgi:hypothetical protein